MGTTTSWSVAFRLLSQVADSTGLVAMLSSVSGSPWRAQLRGLVLGAVQRRQVVCATAAAGEPSAQDRADREAHGGQQARLPATVAA